MVVKTNANHQVERCLTIQNETAAAITEAFSIDIGAKTFPYSLCLTLIDVLM